jgi:single-strand DNA-binding protein
MINKAILVGRLGKDPEIRYTPDGAMVTSFSVATDESWKDKSGERVQKTEWHRIVTFRKLAEICGKYLSKGKLVFIEGRIQTRSWDDKEGKKHYTTEIIANNMQMLDTKGAAKGDDTAAYEAAPQFPDGESLPDDVPF